MKDMLALELAAVGTEAQAGGEYGVNETIGGADKP